MSLLFLSFLFSSSVIADGGNTSGGGERVGKYLRDLQDDGACIVRTGRSFAKSHAPRLEPILKRFGETHWWFSLNLAREISGLKICPVNGKLRTLRTNDLNDFVYYGDNGASMAAIRSEDTVYLDMGAFNALNADSRAYLLVHEAMHSFIEWGVERRNHKVRNIVHAIAEAARKPMSPEDFALQIDHSAVRINRTSEIFDKHREDLLAVFPPQGGFGDSKNEAVLSAAGHLRPHCKWNYYDIAIESGNGWLSRGNAHGLNGLFLEMDRIIAEHASNNDVNEVKRWIGLGADLNEPQLREAISAKHAEIVRMAVEHNPLLANLPGTGSLGGSSCVYGSYILADAIETGDASTVAALLSGDKAKLDRSYYYGRTSVYDRECDDVWGEGLHAATLAVAKENAPVLAVILGHPSFNPKDLREGGLRRQNPKYPSEEGRRSRKILWLSALDLAVEKGRADLVRMLIAAGDSCRENCAGVQPLLDGSKR